MNWSAKPAQSPLLGDPGHRLPGSRAKACSISSRKLGVHRGIQPVRLAACCIDLARDQVPAGESWAAGGRPARRGRGPVLAVDLSGDPLRFCVDDEHRFALRPMTEGDLPDVTRWINAAARRAPGGTSNRSAGAGRRPLRAGHPGRGRGPLLGLGGQRPLGRASARTTGSPTTPSSPCCAVAPTRSASTTSSARRPSSTVGSAPSCCGSSCATSSSRRTTRCSELFAAPDHRNARSLRVLAKLGRDPGAVVRRAAVRTAPSTRWSAAASTSGPCCGPEVSRRRRPARKPGEDRARPPAATSSSPPATSAHGGTATGGRGRRLRVSEACPARACRPAR